ncbi:hypothetical protein [Winogradskyella sp. PG-2]|uniref:hypothetical protein n=1 Tax=Winogradskyella sp. PG-2 TaxID=754409 RepID=UPI0004585CB4|nr:hypothetical protein [Winogradskyella sp. PG-2]BAO74924.1 hypothetical protein WPG_0694 [Winogradskyella sp. PG-2]
MKIIFSIAILLSTALTYGQKSTLIQNINVRAKELKHSINSTGDSLILEGKNSIDKVAIFNSDFEKTFIVNKNKAKIPLLNIPIGRFVTEVKLNNKLIVITLLGHENLKPLEQFSKHKGIKQTDTEAIFISQNIAKHKDLVSAPKILQKPTKAVRFY